MKEGQMVEFHVRCTVKNLHRIRPRDDQYYEHFTVVARDMSACKILAIVLSFSE